ncbi:MAG: DUF2953 domain-containing protein [Lachnospiraceae bacterium]|nr:DUF2953 domain-containing protein [Lachnospiraceae bacterium]
MIHVILAILKIIGILLLILLLLLAGILLSVLFVPIRYRLMAVHTDAKTCGELRITWLLHLISVRLALSTVPKDAKNDVSNDGESIVHSRPELPSLPEIERMIQIRILGISLERIQELFKKRGNKKQSGKTGERKKKKNRKRNKKKNAKKRNTKKKDSEKLTYQNETSRIRNSSSEEQAADIQKADKQKTDKRKTDEQRSDKENAGKQTVDEQNASGHLSDVHKPDTQTSDTQTSDARMSDTQISDAQTSDTQTSDVRNSDIKYVGEQKRKPSLSERWEALIQSFLNKWRAFRDRISRFPARAVQLYRNIRKLLAKPGELKSRALELYQKLQSYEAADVLKECREQLQALLSHYRVRRGSGFLRFGTDDPALTGELTGVLYLLLPVSCTEISIEPQFTERMLELDLSIRGHIRLVHLARTVWWGFRNQRLRRLIRAFRHG